MGCVGALDLLGQACHMHYAISSRHCTEALAVLWLPTAVGAAAGTGMLASFEGGKAVRCAQEATAVCKSASKAAALFDQTSRQTPASQHQHFDTAFGECIMSSFNKVATCMPDSQTLNLVKCLLDLKRA